MNSSNSDGDSLHNNEPGTAGEPGRVPETKTSQSRKSQKKAESPHLVTRVTALRGQHIVPRPALRSSVRRSTLQDFKQIDPEIPYVKTEAAIRDLICSLLERQDRMNEVILCRVIDLEYRTDTLETDYDDLKQEKNSGNPEAEG